MTLIKIKTINSTIRYMNVDNIASFDYAEKADTTCITLKTGSAIYTNGDVTAKLAKAIVTSTDGTIIHLE